MRFIGLFVSRDAGREWAGSHRAMIEEAHRGPPTAAASGYGATSSCPAGSFSVGICQLSSTIEFAELLCTPGWVCTQRLTFVVEGVRGGQFG